MAYIKESLTKSGEKRYQAQVRLNGLRPIVRTFSRKKDATAFVRRVEGDSELSRKLGEPIVDTICFKEIVNLYMRQYEGQDQSTVGRLDYWVTRFGNKSVTQIDEEDIDEGLINLATSRTGSTVNRYKSTLSAVFIFFMRHPDYKKLVKHLKYSNPVRSETISKFSENPAKDRFLDQAEQTTLLSACKKSHWDKLYLLVLLALTTGARKGELLSLKWSSIDFQSRTAALLREKTKTKKPRLLPLTKPVIKELMKFRGNTDVLIFHSTVSKTAPFDIKKAWYKALGESGIDQCRFHDLRHTAASNLVRAGRSLFEVATLLGHSSIQMTQRYSHLAIHDTRDMVDKEMGGLK
jgi:integrase